MPSWVSTDVMMRGPMEALAEFVHRECDPISGHCLWRKAEAPPQTDWREHSYISLGFDGLVTNEDCDFVPTERRIMGEEVLVLYARFETRWSPPLRFFERMTVDYPLLTVYMRVEHEDEETYPQGWFIVQPTSPPPPPPPQPSPALTSTHPDSPHAQECRGKGALTDRIGNKSPLS